MYYIYILHCLDDSLYTGSTPDLRRRMQQHCGLRKGGAKYTHSHPPKAILALWETDTRSHAVCFETHIKQLTRAQKLALIAAPEKWQQMLPQLSQMAVSPVTPQPLESYCSTKKKPQKKG